MTLEPFHAPRIGESERDKELVRTHFKCINCLVDGVRKKTVSVGPTRNLLAISNSSLVGRKWQRRGLASQKKKPEEGAIHALLANMVATHLAVLRSHSFTPLEMAEVRKRL